MTLGILIIHERFFFSHTAEFPFMFILFLCHFYFLQMLRTPPTHQFCMTKCSPTKWLRSWCLGNRTMINGVNVSVKGSEMLFTLSMHGKAIWELGNGYPLNLTSTDIFLLISSVLSHEKCIFIIHKSPSLWYFLK